MEVGAEERDSGNDLNDSGIYGAALWKVKMGFLAEGCKREIFFLLTSSIKMMGGVSSDVLSCV